MFITCAHVTGVTLFHSDGGVRVFRSMADALKQLGYAWICQHVGKNFCEFSHTESFFPARRCNYVYIAHDYVMRDDFGLPLVPADFSALRRSGGNPENQSYQYGPARDLFLASTNVVPAATIFAISRMQMRAAAPQLSRKKAKSRRALPETHMDCQTVGTTTMLQR
jgi:hypothetical protein